MDYLAGWKLGNTGNANKRGNGDSPASNHGSRWANHPGISARRLWSAVRREVSHRRFHTSTGKVRSRRPALAPTFGPRGSCYGSTNELVSSCRIRQANYPVLLCSNETQWTRADLAQKLGAAGIHVTEDDIFSPAPACVQYLKEHNLRPFLLVHPSSRKDYSGLDCSQPNAVVLGDAAEEFTYENLNKAFRILVNADDPVLIALGMGWVYTQSHPTLSPLTPHPSSLLTPHFSPLAPHSSPLTSHLSSPSPLHPAATTTMVVN